MRVPKHILQTKKKKISRKVPFSNQKKMYVRLKKQADASSYCTNQNLIFVHLNEEKNNQKKRLTKDMPDDIIYLQIFFRKGMRL